MIDRSCRNPHCGTITRSSKSEYCRSCEVSIRSHIAQTENVHTGHVTAAHIREVGDEIFNLVPALEVEEPTSVSELLSTVPTVWGLRHAALDLETSGGFNTSYGRILCLCVLLEGESDVRTLHARTYGDERRLLADLRSLWDELDILVTFNGKRFDSRFINGRAVQYGMDPFPQKLHWDLLPYCRKWRLASARLGSVTEALDLPDQKGHVPAEFWNRAVGGDEEAYATIARYCAQDVKVLPALAARIRPMVKSISLGAF